MNKMVFLFLVVAMTCVFSQSLKTKDLEDLNVFVTRGNRLFASNISDITHVDFANLRAVNIDGGEWQELRKGKGKTIRKEDDPGFVEVRLNWAHTLNDDHWVVDYGWFEVAGSSNSYEVVQLFELRDGKLYITQQIEAVTHHGGKAVGAWFNTNKDLLTVKAVADSPNGRCCPTHMNVVVFRWDGTEFRRVSAKAVPLPEDNRSVLDTGKSAWATQTHFFSLDSFADSPRHTGLTSSMRQTGPPSASAPSILTNAGASPWRIQT